MFMIHVAHVRFGTDMPTDGQLRALAQRTHRAVRAGRLTSRAPGTRTARPRRNHLRVYTVMLVSAPATSVSKLTKARRTVAVSW